MCTRIPKDRSGSVLTGADSICTTGNLIPSVPTGSTRKTLTPSVQIRYSRFWRTPRVFCGWEPGEGGLNRMTEEGTFVSYATDPSSRYALHSSIIRKIIQDSSGTIWLATDGGGLARYNPDEDTFTSFVHRRNLPDGTSVSADSIKSLFEDSSGTLWVGFEDAGLAQFNPKTREFLTVPLTDDPYESLSVRSVNEDDQGRLWVGTDGEGLFLITEVDTDRQKITHH